jgi:hypothetical protein
MRTKLTVLCALTAFVAISGATAEATGLIHTSGIAKGAVTLNRLSPNVQKQIMLKRIPGPKGDTGATGSAVGIPGTNGTNGTNGLPGAIGPRGANGTPGADGAVGPKGLTGLTGAAGTNGTNGTNGDQGEMGAPGDIGPQGEPGEDGQDAAAPEYGYAQVLVARHNVNTGAFVPSVWATYSTTLGSETGDTAGGAFRFTCNAAQAPCQVSVKATAVSQVDATNVSFYPRLLVYKQGDGNGGGTLDEQYCEYADGSTGAGYASVAKTQVLAFVAVPVNIGGSADCGIVPAGPAGDVASIVVPAGYYDVDSTFVFVKN